MLVFNTEIMYTACNIINSDTYTYKSLPHKTMENNYYLRMKRNNLFIRKGQFCWSLKI